MMPRINELLNNNLKSICKNDDNGKGTGNYDVYNNVSSNNYHHNHKHSNYNHPNDYSSFPLFGILTTGK